MDRVPRSPIRATGDEEQLASIARHRGVSPPTYPLLVLEAIPRRLTACGPEFGVAGPISPDHGPIDDEAVRRDPSIKLMRRCVEFIRVDYLGDAGLCLD